MHELDGHPRDDGRCGTRRRRQVHEERAQPLPTGGERFGAHLCDDAAIPPPRLLEPFLQVAEVGVEAWGLADLGERGQRTSAACSATIPPANSLTRTFR